MESESKEKALNAPQWVIFFILALVAGAIGGLLAGGVTIIIDDDAQRWEYQEPDLEGPP